MSESHPPAPLHRWLVGPPPRDVVDSIERIVRAPDVRRVAVMPDVHLASEVCVGLVVATSRTIYPGAVGGDIGCGMAAIRFDAPADVLADETFAGRLLAELYRRVPSLKHAKHAAPAAIPCPLLDAPLSHPRLERLKQRDARWQFGTHGRGNHFLEFQGDQGGCLWLMLHSGSRAMGQAITAHHLRTTSERDRSSRLYSLDAECEAGIAYLNDMAWAIEYARANRLAMIESVDEIVAKLCGAHSVAESLIHCDHNHVRREMHFGESLWVHRKGALAARDGELGVIPGSMGTRSFHVRGRGEADSLCSSSHGAGRALSRSEAATKISAAELLRQMRGVWFDHRRSQLLRDEAPAAYKDIAAVMRAQRALTKIERELRPLLSYKG